MILGLVTIRLMLKSITQLKNNNKNNNNNDNNNNNNNNNNNDDGNLICVLNVQLKISLRIGNLQMLLEIGLFKKTKQNKTKEKKRKQRKTKEIKIALSLSYPNSYFYNKRCNMFL